MHKYSKPTTTSIKINKGYEGETIEAKMHRIINNKEPIKDGAPRIYTNRKDGVLPAHDIRADKMDIAVEAMDKVHKDRIAKRENRIAEQAKQGMEAEKKTETKYEKTDPGTGANPSEPAK